MFTRSILTLLRPEVLADRPSKYNDRVIVKQGWNYRYITTNNQAVTQSGGIVKEVWQPALKKVGFPQKSWLILGLAGGTLASMIAKDYFPSQMIGVEIDPVMIEVGIEFFHIDSIPNLKIVNADAKKYLSGLKSNFDYILVDLYFGEHPPQFIYSRNFIKNLKKSGQTVIVNHMFYNSSTKKSASLIVENLSSHFTRVELVRSLANLLIICS